MENFIKNLEFNYNEICKFRETITKIKKNLISINKLFKNSQFIMGEDVLKLENKLKNYVGVKYCISTSSGTDALLIALMSLRLKKGSEIITTPFTYVSTAEIILRLGMKPVFVDVDYDTCNISIKEIRKNIKKTKAIIPVSLFLAKQQIFQKLIK